MSSGKRRHKAVSKDDGSEGAGGPEDTTRAEGGTARYAAACPNCNKVHDSARARRVCDAKFALSAVCDFYDADGGRYERVVTRPSATEPFTCPNTKCRVSGRSQQYSASSFIQHAKQCIIESPSDISLSGNDSMSQSTGLSSAALLGGSVSAASTLFQRQVRARGETAGEEGGSSSNHEASSILSGGGSSRGSLASSGSSSSGRRFLLSRSSTGGVLVQELTLGGDGKVPGQAISSGISCLAPSAKATLLSRKINMGKIRSSSTIVLEDGGGGGGASGGIGPNRASASTTAAGEEFAEGESNSSSSSSSSSHGGQDDPVPATIATPDEPPEINAELTQLLFSKARVFRRPAPESHLAALPRDNILSKLGYELNTHTATLCCRHCGSFVSEVDPARHVRDNHKERWKSMGVKPVKDDVIMAARVALCLAKNDMTAELSHHGQACLTTVQELRARAPDAPLPDGVEGCTIREGVRCQDCPRVGVIDCNDVYTDDKTLLVHQRAKHGHLSGFLPSLPCFYQELCVQVNVPYHKLYRVEVRIYRIFIQLKLIDFCTQRHPNCFNLHPHSQVAEPKYLDIRAVAAEQRARLKTIQSL